MHTLQNMTEEDKSSFKPQPSERDRMYEVCSHVEFVQDLPQLFSWDVRKSVAEARDGRERPELPDEVSSDSTTSAYEMDPADVNTLKSFTGCSDIKLIKKLHKEAKSTLLQPDMLMDEAGNLISARMAIDASELKRRAEEAETGVLETLGSKEVEAVGGGGKRSRLGTSGRARRDSARTDARDGDRGGGSGSGGPFLE